MTSNSHTVTVAGPEQLCFDAAAGESVLAAAVRMRVAAIPSGCHGGGCGVCRIRVVSGRYDTGRMSRAHVSEEAEADGITLACRTYAHDDLLVEPTTTPRLTQPNKGNN